MLLCQVCPPVRHVKFVATLSSVGWFEVKLWSRLVDQLNSMLKNFGVYGYGDVTYNALIVFAGSVDVVLSPRHSHRSFTVAVTPNHSRVTILWTDMEINIVHRGTSFCVYG